MSLLCNCCVIQGAKRYQCISKKPNVEITGYLHWFQKPNPKVLKKAELLNTRMHSSRMRTTRFSGRLSCHAHPLACMSYTMNATLPHTLPAMYAPCHTCPPQPPWTEGMTHACENITLPETTFAGGKNMSFV